MPTAAKMLILVFWLVPPCWVVKVDNVSEEHPVNIFIPEDGDRMLHRNVGSFLSSSPNDVITKKTNMDKTVTLVLG